MNLPSRDGGVWSGDRSGSILPEVELERLKYFVAVAEEGSRAGAARRLYLTCSAVSQQISKLEGELGIELFRRRGRRTELTEAGEVLLEGTRQALEKIELAIADARRASWTEDSAKRDSGPPPKGAPRRPRERY
ncbi:MAG: LysR family transcriptional regulator [Rubrobacteraceae bacterium]|uniref:LysR family transcriptional regulator n=1 Tax=Rubrobacter naiadicus TaxID=1392641 RepID=UPI00235FF82B|nr:LysR family transcriptional regulator [Rubrobacter naiadicus]MCL6437438.1 LysR family transcriptional regulator [Rubrobacteraceae bacterium]